jgi:hypothetical protein
VDEDGFKTGAAVLMSVRPEKLQLVTAGRGRLDGTVQERFFLGSQWLYRIATPAGDLMVLSPNDGRDALDEGNAVGIDWPAHCTRLLPAEEAVAAGMSGIKNKATPWWLSGPALLLFTALLLVPLLLTAVLSFNVYDPATGPKAGEFTLEHYAHVFTDSYYHGIFWRTFWISALVTLICVVIGAPEAYVLSRMRNPVALDPPAGGARAAAGVGGGARLRLEHAARARGRGEPGCWASLGIGPVKMLYTEIAP